MSLSVTRDVPVSLTAVLGDGRTNMFPRAYVTDGLGTERAVVNMPHIGRGKYQAAWTATFLGYASATIIVYTDAAHTIVSSEFDLGEDKYFITEKSNTIVIDVAPVLTIPTVAPDLIYPIGLSIRTDTGAAVDADSLPVISIMDALNNPLITPTTMTLSGVGTGSYYYSFAVPSTFTPGIIRISISVTLSSVTNVVTKLSELQLNVASAAALEIAKAVWDELLPPTHNILQSAGSLVQIINRDAQQVNNYVQGEPLYGLPAIRNVIEGGDLKSYDEIVVVRTKVDDMAAQNALDTAAIIVKIDTFGTMEANITGAILTSTTTLTAEIDQNENILTLLIKPQTDLIVANQATTADIAIIEAKIDTKPSLTELNNAIAAQTAVLEGADSRDLTEVYNSQRGTDNALLANDPRLANLDAAISTRSTLTDALVWSYATRTLTSAVVLDPAGVWNYLTSAATLAGSMGKLVVDNLDAKVSTRSTLTSADITAANATLAKETTVVDSRDQVLVQVGLVDLHVLANKTVLDAIKPRTDLIIAGGATEANVTARSVTTDALITTLTSTTNTIKVKTDLIPAFPATETTLLAIPTNPLLTNDPRLTDLNLLVNLDMKVSDVAAQFPTDYAKELTLTTSSAQIRADIAVVDIKVTVLPGTAYFNPQFAKSDAILTGIGEIKGAGFTSSDSLVSIKTSIPLSSTVAVDVWAQPARTLTSYPAFATANDVTTSASNTVATLSQYYCMMGTALDTLTARQHVTCWLVYNSAIVTTADNARITVSKPGTVLWTRNIPLPDAAGLFNVTVDVSGDYFPGVVYTAEIKIKAGGNIYSTVQPFMAVV